MKLPCLTLLITLALAAPTATAQATPPGPPTDPASAMYTLLDIWNRLMANTLGTKRTTIFSEPGAGPGTGTGKTLNEVYAAALPTKLPKTGQTTFTYSTDDGALKKGIAWPNPRFTDHSNGTVTDNLTGLIWLKNANCFGSIGDISVGVFCYNLASGSCGLTDGSVQGDWRPPNVRELQSLIDYGQANPALPSAHPFTNVQTGYYWTSTLHLGTHHYYYRVSLSNGTQNVSGQFDDLAFVWPVRGGE